MDNKWFYFTAGAAVGSTVVGLLWRRVDQTLRHELEWLRHELEWLRIDAINFMARARENWDYLNPNNYDRQSAVWKAHEVTAIWMRRHY